MHFREPAQTHVYLLHMHTTTTTTWYALSSSPSSRGVNINYRTAATPTAHNQCFDRTALGHDHLDLQLEMPGHAPASNARVYTLLAGSGQCVYLHYISSLRSHVSPPRVVGRR